jgi:predicted DNA-binding protein (UPF0251 family)
MRPRKCRHISIEPKSTLYKPAGIPARFLEFVNLEIEEMEAIKLAHYEGLYHDEAGKRMGVSRQTFSRILNAANQKVSAALVEGKGLVIQDKKDELSPPSE